MARRMRDCRKLVFSRTGGEPVSGWVNVERVVAGSDAELRDCLVALKGQPGGDIHLSGGAGFAQSVVALGLVDEFRFFLYPTVSARKPWFSALKEKLDMELVDSGVYANGVVRLHYLPKPSQDKATAASFTDLLT